MGLFDGFKKKKEEQAAQKAAEKEEEEISNLLRNVCGDDTALYQDMSSTMDSSPPVSGSYSKSMENGQLVEARIKERAGAPDVEALKSLARGHYHEAVDWALYKGTAKELKDALTKLEGMSGTKYPRMMEVPENAIEKTGECYTRLAEIKERVAILRKERSARMTGPGA